MKLSQISKETKQFIIVMSIIFTIGTLLMVYSINGIHEAVKEKTYAGVGICFYNNESQTFFGFYYVGQPINNGSWAGGFTNITPHGSFIIALNITDVSKGSLKVEMMGRWNLNETGPSSVVDVNLSLGDGWVPGTLKTFVLDKAGA